MLSMIKRSKEILVCFHVIYSFLLFHVCWGNLELLHRIGINRVMRFSIKHIRSRTYGLPDSYITCNDLESYERSIWSPARLSGEEFGDISNVMNDKKIKCNPSMFPCNLLLHSVPYLKVKFGITSSDKSK